MYEEYFLDYASYVILERAIPAINDGLKPVQRRILHAMKEMDDGRYNKVANIIGQTMQYHPHGDAAIGDALVNLGQMGLLIDTQGNWGDVRTGDGAAASRYIEARLTKFALEVAFNADTTQWQLSYDGRKNEPVFLPMKFPLVLAQGTEGIAVGLSTKILPHNFIELCKASIDILKKKSVRILPDFSTGGVMDATDYNDGLRGGKIRVRGLLEITKDKKNILIKELPAGITTGGLIDSIVKANEKGKIKIKRIIDNTAANVEIQLELMPGVSAEVTVDALYAFTDCEVSISPNACVIIEDKPHFVNVLDILKFNTQHTRTLLGKELEIQKQALDEKWHFASLEKIFIEKRIYHDIEECESWEQVVKVIFKGLKKYIVTPAEKPKATDKRLRLMREISNEDIERLTEIKIRRISKYNVFKANEQIKQIEEEQKQVKHHLAHLTDYTIKYYERLLEKYGKGRERKTKITTFGSVAAVEVVAQNAKLYVNAKDGFIGYGLKKDEFVCDCSDIDDIIAIRRDGKFMVTRIGDKKFVGKDIMHVAVWKRDDTRTTYNLIYVDGKSLIAYAKRFNVTSITRDKEYDLTKGNPLSKTQYLSVNPNGEAEVVTIYLSPNSKARKKELDFDFKDIEIKNRSALGVIATKYPIRKISMAEAGTSTLGDLSVMYDPMTGTLNTAGRGVAVGALNAGDLLIGLYNDGTYEITEFEMSARFDQTKLISLHPLMEDCVISAIYYDGNKKCTMIKRFEIETQSTGQRFTFITEHKDSRLNYVTVHPDPEVHVEYQGKKKVEAEEILLAEFIDVKGWKALGNKLIDGKIILVEPLHTKKSGQQTLNLDDSDTFKPGDVIELK